jgi:hypothetical protein
METNIETGENLQCCADGEYLNLTIGDLNPFKVAKKVGSFTKKKVQGIGTDVKNIKKTTSQASKFVAKKAKGVGTDVKNIAKTAKKVASNRIVQGVATGGGSELGRAAKKAGIARVAKAVATGGGSEILNTRAGRAVATGGGSELWENRKKIANVAKKAVNNRLVQAVVTGGASEAKRFYDKNKGKIIDFLRRWNPGLILVRGAYQGLLRLNLWGMATDLKALKDAAAKGDKAAEAKYKKAQNVWDSLGGIRSVFDHTVETGSHERIIFKRHSADGTDEGYSNIAPAAIPAMLAAASTVVVKVIDVIGKNKNNSEAFDPTTRGQLIRDAKENDQTIAQGQSQIESQYNSMPPEQQQAFIQNAVNANPNVSEEDVQALIQAKGGKVTLQDIKALSDSKGGQLGSKGGFPTWGWYVVGGVFAASLVTVILLVTKKKK